MTRAPSGGEPAAPTRVIRPPSATTVTPLRGSRPVPSISIASWMTMGCGMRDSLWQRRVGVGGKAVVLEGDVELVSLELAELELALVLLPGFVSHRERLRELRGADRDS